MIELLIPGKPVPNNTKYAVRGGKLYGYKTKEYYAYKKYIQSFVAEYMIKHKMKPLNVPVRVEITVYITIPKSYSKKRRNALLYAPAPVNPDGDNVCKTILDSISKEKNLSHCFLENDKLACEIEVGKYYSETAYVSVVVLPIPSIHPSTLEAYKL